MTTTQSNTQEARIEAALRALREAKAILVYDDEHAGAGGFVCAAANHISTKVVNFMAAEARGLICIALSEARMKRLAIPMMVGESPYARRLSFGASIEASRGVTTGISAGDRAVTIDAASAADAGPDDIVMPGHVFPIQVRTGGVLVKPGVPEAISDLCEMAGLSSSASLCTVLDAEGEVADLDFLREFSTRFDLAMVCVGDVVARRLGSDLVVERIAERDIESDFGGSFRAIVYRNDFDRYEHVALTTGDITNDEAVTVRVHSQCLTGDVFGSTRCDCGDQLELAINSISREGRGVIVYMHQEGRGIGLANKIRAYALQDKGRDTVEANLELGFDEDLRDYGIAAQIIKDLGIRQVRLLTNNPQKIEGLERYGVEVVERTAIETPAHEHNIAYLRTKKRKLGHLLDDSSLADSEKERP